MIEIEEISLRLYASTNEDCDALVIGAPCDVLEADHLYCWWYGDIVDRMDNAVRESLSGLYDTELDFLRAYLDADPGFWSRVIAVQG